MGSPIVAVHAVDADAATGRGTDEVVVADVDAGV